MTLPPKRERPRSGITRGPQREWPQHRRFVRTFACAVPGCPELAVCAHLRTAENSGAGLRPPDWDTAPLCDAHHKELDTPRPRDCEPDRNRFERFAKKYGVDLWAIAAAVVSKSTNLKMKEAMKGNEEWTETPNSR